MQCERGQKKKPRDGCRGQQRCKKKKEGIVLVRKEIRKTKQTNINQTKNAMERS